MTETGEWLPVGDVGDPFFGGKGDEVTECHAGVVQANRFDSERGDGSPLVDGSEKEGGRHFVQGDGEKLAGQEAVQELMETLPPPARSVEVEPPSLIERFKEGEAADMVHVTVGDEEVDLLPLFGLFLSQRVESGPGIQDQRRFARGDLEARGVAAVEPRFLARNRDRTADPPKPDCCFHRLKPAPFFEKSVQPDPGGDHQPQNDGEA